jgi:hypothetical protein
MDDEVDVTLVDAMLALTPEQRLEHNDRMLQMIEELRDGLARVAKPAPSAGNERR